MAAIYVNFIYEYRLRISFGKKNFARTSLEFHSNFIWSTESAHLQNAFEYFDS